MNCSMWKAKAMRKKGLMIISLMVTGYILSQDPDLATSDATGLLHNSMPPAKPIAESSAVAESGIQVSRAIRGLHLEGPWQSERIALVLSVKDCFVDRLGKERFNELVEQGVAQGSAGRIRWLILRFDPSPAYQVASWTPECGQITLYESLFDQAHMDRHYRWRFLDRLHEAQPRPVTIQEFTIGHELGHVLIDGLREEHLANGFAPTYLEDIYAESLNIDFWADPFQEPNESLASEVALWAFDIRRPWQVRDYRERYLVPALVSETGAAITGPGE